MTSRRQAIAFAAATIVIRPAAAFAATDRGPLIGLVAYEQAVVSEYEAALTRGSLSGSERATLQRFRGEAAQAAASLRKALEDEGGTAPAAADPKTIPAPADWLRDVIRVEELSVAAYYAALQSMDDDRHLRGAAAFMAQAGRRLVVLRKLAGIPVLPRAFETGGA